MTTEKYQKMKRATFLVAIITILTQIPQRSVTQIHGWGFKAN